MVTALSKLQGINLSCLVDIYRPRSLSKAEKSVSYQILDTHFLQFLLASAIGPQPVRNLNTSLSARLISDTFILYHELHQSVLCSCLKVLRASVQHCFFSVFLLCPVFYLVSVSYQHLCTFHWKIIP